MERYDLVVIGAGPGGHAAALCAARHGMKTAVIEKSHLGGCCLNRGCVPTKSLLSAAHLYEEIGRAGGYGISVSSVSYDLGELYRQKNDTVERLRQGIEQLYKLRRITLLRGRAVVTGPHHVTVRGEEEQTLSADRILIATGGRAALLPDALQTVEGVYTSDDLLAEAPPPRFQRLVVLGAGVVGIEFASLYQALGCEVTMISKYDKPLRRLDREISQNLAMILKKRGVRMRHAPTLDHIEKTPAGLVCGFTEKDEPQRLECDAVLVAVGWRSDTEGLFEGWGGVRYDAVGGVDVDEHFRTSIETIYAIGDCTSTSRLAHVASAQGVNAVCHMLGKPPKMDLSAVPSCVYTAPEIAVVGMSADEAKAAGRPTRVGKYVMTSNARSMISKQERSFIKVVFDAESDVILGAQLMCERATDLVGELCAAISNRLTAAELGRVIRPHPTFSEGISEALENAGERET